jgi:hypothetical protein
MADDQHDYKVGPGRPPLHTRFRKGQAVAGNEPREAASRQADIARAVAVSRPSVSRIEGGRRRPRGLKDVTSCIRVRPSCARVRALWPPPPSPAGLGLLCRG